MTTFRFLGVTLDRPIPLDYSYASLMPAASLVMADFTTLHGTVIAAGIVAALVAFCLFSFCSQDNQNNFSRRIAVGALGCGSVLATTAMVIAVT
jgi:hypothetical protein